MTLAVGETSQTRINAEIRRTEQRMTKIEGRFVQGSRVLTYAGTPAGLFPIEQIFRLNTDLAGANVATVQSVFGVGVTLAASTVYVFEIVAALTKTAGVTSHTVALGYGGTATLNSSSYVTTYNNASSAPGTGVASFIMHREAVTSQVMTAAITAASAQFRWTVLGTLSINAAGTFIPQYTLSAAPGGAYSTEQGSYMRIYPIGPSGTNTSIGAWS